MGQLETEDIERAGVDLFKLIESKEKDGAQTIISKA
jgi:hypothetical protein